MKASEDEFGHVRAVKEHSVEVLKRYFYKHSNGVTPFLEAGPTKAGLRLLSREQKLSRTLRTRSIE